MGSRMMTDKASNFAEHASRVGWKTEVDRNGTHSTVRATRESDGAVLSITWEGSKCLNECRITVKGDTKKLRNAAACYRAIDGEEEALPRQSGKSNPADPPADDDDSGDDIEWTRLEPVWGQKHGAAPDPIVLQAVTGKTVVWINSKTRNAESVRVPDKPRHLRIETSPVTLRRALTVPAAGEGFRSFYIDQIVSVS